MSETTENKPKVIIERHQVNEIAVLNLNMYIDFRGPSVHFSRLKLYGDRVN